MKLRCRLNRKVDTFIYNNTGKKYIIISRRYKYEPYYLFNIRHKLKVKYRKLKVKLNDKLIK